MESKAKLLGGEAGAFNGIETTGRPPLDADADPDTAPFRSCTHAESRIQVRCSDARSPLAN